MRSAAKYALSLNSLEVQSKDKEFFNADFADLYRSRVYFISHQCQSVRSAAKYALSLNSSEVQSKDKEFFNADFAADHSRRL